MISEATWSSIGPVTKMMRSFEQARIDVIGPLAAVGQLDHHGHQRIQVDIGEVIHPTFPGFYWLVLTECDQCFAWRRPTRLPPEVPRQAEGIAT